MFDSTLGKPSPREIEEFVLTKRKLMSSGSKSFTFAFFLAVWGGWLGLDAFYMGHFRRGILKLATCGGFFVLWVVDAVRIYQGTVLDSRGNELAVVSRVGRRLSINYVLSFCIVLLLAVWGSSFAGRQFSSTTNLQNSSMGSTETGTTNACTEIHTQITVIRNAFQDAEHTVGQISLLLNTAADEFLNAAGAFDGSKQAWARKMSELTLKVDRYIVDGQGDGATSLDQLYNNFGLYPQFCE